MPVSVVKRLRRCAHGKNDEIVDLALLFRLHPFVGVEGTLRAVAAWNLAGNLAGNVGYIEILDVPDAALAGQQPLPGPLDPAGERHHHAKTCDNDASHEGAPDRRIGRDGSQEGRCKASCAHVAADHPPDCHLPAHHPPAHHPPAHAAVRMSRC